MVFLVLARPKFTSCIADIVLASSPVVYRSKFTSCMTLLHKFPVSNLPEVVHLRPAPPSRSSEPHTPDQVYSPNGLSLTTPRISAGCRAPWRAPGQTHHHGPRPCSASYQNTCSGHTWCGAWGEKLFCILSKYMLGGTYVLRDSTRFL